MGFWTIAMFVAGAAIIAMAAMLPSGNPDQECPAEDADALDGLEAEEKTYLRRWTRN